LILDTSTLHFKKQGHGAALIVLHGIFGSGDNWQTLANTLQDQFTVYLIDQRNHGRSFHTDDFDLDVLADDISYIYH
jgi:esterase